MGTNAVEAPRQTRRRGRKVRILVGVCLVVAMLCASWVVVGNLRAEDMARDYFAHAHGMATVTNVTVESVSPAIPPFWQVEISGDVTEPGDTSPVYRSYMRLWVEPFSGFVYVNGAG